MPLYIEHEAVDEADGIAYFGPFSEDEIDERLNGPYADLVSQDGNIECVELTEERAAELYINPREFWMEQEADCG